MLITYFCFLISHKLSTVLAILQLRYLSNVNIVINSVFLIMWATGQQQVSNICFLESVWTLRTRTLKMKQVFNRFAALYVYFIAITTAGRANKIHGDFDKTFFYIFSAFEANFFIWCQM